MSNHEEVIWGITNNLSYDRYWHTGELNLVLEKQGFILNPEQTVETLLLTLSRI